MRRRKDRVDDNQAAIVARLRKMSGVSVEVGHDDILVGYKGKTFWFEIKNPDKLKQDGSFKKGALKDDQKRILQSFTGHYRIVASFDEILVDIA